MLFKTNDASTSLQFKIKFYCSEDLKKKRKYRLKFPVFIYFFFEKLNFSYWTSTTVKANHYICCVPAEINQPLNSVLSHEFYLNKSQLLEATTFDLTNQQILDNDFFFFLKKNNLISLYSYFFFFLKKRITFFMHTSNKIKSAESFYSNANWLEREMSEMFGVTFLLKKDSRNLLLDYGTNYNPFLKKFPATGHSEVVFNSFLKTTVYSPIITTEL